MSELTFSKGLPESDAFRQALAQAIATSNPIDDLLELSARLYEFEQRYQISSNDFYKRYQDGALEDELQHCIEWVAVYELFMKTRQVLEATLMRAAIRSELSEVPV